MAEVDVKDDDDGENRMSASVGRVVHRVCMSEASSEWRCGRCC